MRVISFVDYTPSPRYDNVPWANLRVEQSLDRTADTWTVIETKPLSPLDADPTQPQARHFTTDNGSEDPKMWYRVIFIDADGNEELPTAPVRYEVELIQEYLPSIADVAALLRARTVDDVGNELGTFTDKTRPTASQVDRIIQLAANDVIGQTDNDIPEESWETAASTIALKAAMMIELGYFPELVGTDKSPYSRYKDLYDDQLVILQRSVEREAYEEQVGEQPESIAPIGGQTPAPINWDTVVL